MPIRTLSGTDEEIGKLKLKNPLKQIQKAAVKVQDKIKDTGVVKKASELQDRAKDTGVVKTAAKVQQEFKEGAEKAGNKVMTIAKKGAAILKDIPQAAKVVVGAPGRRAFRTLVALNFHNYANKLKAAGDKTFETWKAIGGIREELEQSINAGLKRKAILGIGCLDCRIQTRGVQGIGDPATIAAALAAAAPIIAVFAGILKEALSVINKAKEAFKKDAPADSAPQEPGSSDRPQEPPVPENPYSAPEGSQRGFEAPSGWPPPNYYSAGNEGQNTTTTSQDTVAKEEKKDNTALLVGAAVLAKLLLF